MKIGKVTEHPDDADAEVERAGNFIVLGATEAELDLICGYCLTPDERLIP